MIAYIYRNVAGYLLTWENNGTSYVDFFETKKEAVEYAVCIGKLPRIMEG